MVEASFTLTLRDYREANGLLAARPRKGGWALSLAGWFAFLFLAVILFMLTRPEPPAVAAGAAAAPFPYLRLLLALAAPAVLLGIFVYLMVRGVRRPPKPWVVVDPRDRSKKGSILSVRWLVSWVVFVLLATTLFTLLREFRTSQAGAADAANVPARLPPLYDFLLPLGPLLLSIAVLLVVGHWSTKRAAADRWEAMAHEQKPRTLKADEHGVEFQQSDARQWHAWSYFAGYKETDGLILLYPSLHSFYMVPKRAFGDAFALDAFKGLVMNGIPEGHFAPAERTAFPVLPVEQPSAPPPPAGAA